MTILIRRVPAVLLALAVLAHGAPASAQLLAAKDGPVVYGHHHLNVSDQAASRKFFVDALGGVPSKGNAATVMFPNALLMMVAKKPTAGSKGSTVDHIAFSVNNLKQVVDRIKAAGFPIVTAAEAPANIKVVDGIGVVDGTGPVSGLAYAMAPDDMKVELVEIKSQTAPIASHHVHFTGPQKDMQAWYMQTFGAAAGTSANPAAFISATLPGLTMNFTPAQGTAGTQGRAIDHIGFEVKGLEAFVKQLEAKGVKMNRGYTPFGTMAIAFLTDPWGTYIELTEGLATIN